jgi:hypothetical protein
MPATSIGTFPKDVPYPVCFLFAQRAMQLNFVEVFGGFSDSFSVVGTGSGSVHPGVTVIIACIPNGNNTWVEVYVNSDDTAEADSLRNALRTQIQNATIFDPPPLHPLRALSYEEAAKANPSLTPFEGRHEGLKATKTA